MAPDRDRWINRQVYARRSEAKWRLSRAVLSRGCLSIYEPGPGIANAFSDPADSLQETAVKTKNISDVSHSSISLDPFLEESIPENVNTFVLNEFSPTATALAIPADKVAALLRSKIEDPSTNEEILGKVSQFIQDVVCLPGLILNDRVFSALQELASAVGTRDTPFAEKLKLELFQAFERVQSMLDTVGISSTYHSRHSISGPLSVLERNEVIPMELFLDMKFMNQLAYEISAFHRVFWTHWPPTKDISILFHTQGSASEWRLNPLVFDRHNPHFLSRQIYAHAFDLKYSAKDRGMLLRQWLRLGNRLHDLGDIVGWSAIACTVCQPAILRLRDLWAYVPADSRMMLAQDWGFEVFELDKRASIDVLSKKTFRTSTEHMGSKYSKKSCVPYFGDIIITDSGKIKNIMKTTQDQISRIQAVIDGWNRYVASQPEGPVVSEPALIPGLQQTLAAWLKKSASSPQPDPMSLSLSVYPREFGAYLHLFYNDKLPLLSGAHIPVLFTQATPYFRLFPRGVLIPPGPDEQQQPRLRRSNSFPPAQLATGIQALESGAREQYARQPSAHVLAHVVRDFLNLGAETFHTQKDIIFKALESEERVNSGRGSRASSLFENLGRRSLLIDAQSRRQSLQSVDIQQRRSSVSVVVKAATLVRLVDVLVIGAGEFGQVQGPEFSLDLVTHMQTLLATYRNFCSTRELLDMLYIRVVSAGGAARQILAHKNLRWERASSPLSPAESRLAGQIHNNIIETCQHWIAEYFMDFDDDSSALDSMYRLCMVLKQEPIGDADSARRLMSSFLKQRYRVFGKPRPPPEYPLAQAECLLPPQDAIEPFIDDLDRILADAFGRVSLPDWMKLFELLEVQAASPAGLFLYNPTSLTSPEDVQILTIFSWLATLQCPGKKDLVIDLLPPCLSALFKLHQSLEAFFAFQITDPALTHFPLDRSERMVTLLKMLGILRSRMQFFDVFPDNSDSRVPSLLGSAIVAAIMRPESRAFAASWQRAGREVAAWCGDDPLETPNQFRLYVPRKVQAHGTRPITPCPGWIAERLAEIICCVPNLSVENPHLINFDKMRYAFNFVRNIESEFVIGSLGKVSESLVRHYAGILTHPLVPLDRKAFKEGLNREKRGRLRVFQSIVQDEIEKLKLEARVYEKIAPNTASNLPISQSASSLYSKRLSRLSFSSGPTSSIPPSPSVGGSKRSPRGRLGGFFRATVRPLSMLATSDYRSESPEICPPHLLPSFSSLPTLDDSTYWKVLSRIDFSKTPATVTRPRPHQSTFVVAIDNQQYVLQATSSEDAQKWADAIELASANTGVFGVPLDILWEDPANRPIPAFLSALLDHIEEVGLEEVGLYRTSGSLSSINSLKASFNAGERTLPEDDPRWCDINAVAGVLKAFLRELPEPLLTNKLFHRFVACANAPTLDEQLNQLSNCIQALPLVNKNILSRLCLHLNKVVQHQQVNRMTTPNLSIVFSMNFLPPYAMDQMRTMQQIVSLMISHVDRLFPVL